jgi:hypothetical protein
VNHARGIGALIGGAVIFSGCGGGGTAPAVSHAVAPAATATVAPGAVPLATAKLTLAFPATFFTAKPGTSAKSSTASVRRPAYVNPTNNENLDVFVDGVDETPNLTVSNTNDGTQTITIGIYSTAAHQIVAIETAGGLNSGQVLAIGETDVPAASFNPGDVSAIGLTMLMNATGIGITDNNNNSNNGSADAVFGTMSSSPIAFTDSDVCHIPGVGNYLYVFGTDLTGGTTGFISNAGAGVPVVSLSSAVNLPGTTPPSDSLVFPYGINSYFQINYNSYSGGLLLTTQLTNPAAVTVQAAYNNIQAYPGITALYNAGQIYNVIGYINTSPLIIQIEVTPEYGSVCD